MWLIIMTPRRYKTSKKELTSDSFPGKAYDVDVPTLHEAIWCFRTYKSGLLNIARHIFTRRFRLELALWNVSMTTDQ